MVRFVILSFVIALMLAIGSLGGAFAATVALLGGIGLFTLAITAWSGLANRS